MFSANPISSKRNVILLTAWCCFLMTACAPNSGRPDLPEKSAPEREDRSHDEPELVPGNDGTTPVADMRDVEYTGDQGPFGCPTVEQPKLTVGSLALDIAPQTDVPKSLSPAFSTSCSACHGALGKGKGAYPALPGKLSQGEFIAVVRSGRGNMPAYAANYVSDAQLEADYKTLSALAGSSGEATTSDAAAVFANDKLERVLSTGLKAWRTPDSKGFACAGCHAPDALDLAFIGYQDDQILRRAALHVDPEIANQIVHFVHAQRQVWNIQKPCSPTWRVLQPGGEVLPGNTVDEQEKSFWDQLVAMDLALVKRPVRSLEDATRVMDELGDINLRNLKLGIPFARWTEDRFNGPAHATWNDYMPMLGTIPNEPDSWYRRLDDYVADPSDERFYGIYANVVQAVHDGGHAAKFPEQLQSRVRPYPDASGERPKETVGTFLSGLNMDKRRMNLVLQHIIRTELRKPGSWQAGKIVPFDNAPELVNPFLKFALQSIEGLLDAGSGDELHTKFLPSFPEDFIKEIPEEGDDRVFHNLAKEVNHPWMTLAQVYDQTNFSSPSGIGNAMVYWSGLKFDQKYIHMPFMHFHRLVTQEKNMDIYAKRQRAAYPASPSMFLDGHNTQQVQTYDYTESRKTTLNKESNLLKANIVRTMFLYQKHLIEGGYKVFRYYAQDHQRGFGSYQINDTRKFIQNLQEDIAAHRAHPLIMENAALYTTEFLTLINEVQALMLANLEPCRPSDPKVCEETQP